MNRISHDTIIMLLLPLLLAGQPALASFDGTYAYYDYFQEFHSGILPSIGETKSINTSASTVTVSSGTFSAIFRDSNMDRSIMNQYTAEAEPRCINAYSTSLSTEAEPAGGTIAPADNLVLNITPGDEPDLLFPLYFNRTTNVALNIEGTSTNYPNECGFGLLVRQGSGMSNSQLDGTYLRYTFGNSAQISAPGSHDGMSLERAVMQFDGAGNYSETTDGWGIARVTGETNLLDGSDTVVQTYNLLTEAEESILATNGTYSLMPDGTLMISSEVGTITNQLSPDANLAASTLALDFAPFFGTYYTVVLKQPENMITNGIDAVYFLTEFYEEFFSESTAYAVNQNAISLSRAYLFLNSDGTFDLRHDYWDVENVIENAWFDYDPGPATNLIARNIISTYDSGRITGFEHGTYTIQTNGMLHLDIAGDDSIEVQLSENGEYLAFGYASADAGEAERAFGVGIRRTAPADPSTPVVFEDISMTSTGLVLTVGMPIDYPVEGLYTDSLTSGEWFLGAILSSDTGELEISDSDVATQDRRFYRAAFLPW